MRTVGLAAMLALSASQVFAAPAAWKRLDPASFQSFVQNWSPDGAPLCAVMRSEADWDSVMHPAPVMGPHKPFAPAPKFWRDRAVLIVARVVDGGGKGEPFDRAGLTRTLGGTEVSYRFQAPPKASYQIKSALMIEAARPLMWPIRFRENGKLICTVHPGDRRAR